MKVDIRIQTDGREIYVPFSNMRLHPTLNSEMANLHLQIGDTTVNIDFNSWAEMEKFCIEHNFPFDDERSV